MKLSMCVPSEASEPLTQHDYSQAATSECCRSSVSPTYSDLQMLVGIGYRMSGGSGAVVTVELDRIEEPDESASRL
jgi:hypothetical protein